jgi:hypothetical protein
MLIKIKRNGVIAINSILASFFLTGCGDDSVQKQLLTQP